MSLRALTYLTLALVLGMSSCKKEDEPVAEIPGDNTAILPIHAWGDELFEMNTEYPWGAGTVKFQEIRFYISDLQFQGSSPMESTTFMDQAWLMDASDDGLQGVGRVEFGQIEQVEMLLGLNETLNHTEDPANAEPPLNNGSMHWSWNPEAGYKFIKIEGEQDVDGDGTFELFSIHAATDNLKREIIRETLIQKDNDSFAIVMFFDYEAMFAGVDFGNLADTHGDSELTNMIATQFADAIEID